MSKFQGAIKKWTEENKPIGEMLGYPDCCIQEFCNQPPEVLKHSTPSKGDKRRVKASYVDGNYTGFIPCAAHAKEIIAGKITLASLVDEEKRQKSEFFIPVFPNATA